MPAGRVLLAGAFALVLAALLNADALVRDAEQKPFGRSRDVSLAVWRPVQSVSHALGLSWPRRWADEALGRDVGDGEVLEVVLASPEEVSSTSGDSSGSGGIEPGAQPPDPAVPAPTTVEASGGPGEGLSSDPGSSPPTPTSAPPAPDPVVRAVPTAEAPLRLWVGGDSISQVFGESLVRMASQTGVIAPELDYRISSGLTRPDYFNWPVHLVDVLSDGPDVVVIIFGANDAQGMELSNGVFQPFEDEWVAEYTSRVAAVMDQLAADPERIVIWVGQPRMRSDKFDARMQRLNEIYRAQASLRDNIHFLDTVPLFSDADGRYNAFLTGVDGEVHNMRQQDGTHLSRPGGDLLARAILDLLGTIVDLDSGKTPAVSSTTDAGG